MLDQSTRIAIVRLHKEGHGIRPIARALKVSRATVKEVLKSGTIEVVPMRRSEKAEAYRKDILELFVSCRGNLIRVHEELVKKGAAFSYQALTAFCRRHEIGHAPKLPAGHYDFHPGQEMQHDTSPHQAKIGGKLQKVQTASLVLCYSRMIFIQLSLTFTRFDCKVFLTEALKYFAGACKICMIDNTHVVVLKGTGKKMVAVPEMVAFADRYHFEFKAHELGDANRSARVEGPFYYVENNFLAGREFTDLEHANREALAWCDKVNAAHSRKLHTSRRELFAVEAPHLQPLPIWVPDVYRLHHRIVDAEGYVNVNGNRYSAPYALIGRRLEARETKDRIEVFDGPRSVASHARVEGAIDKRVTLPEHRPPRGQGRPKEGPPPEEQELLLIEPELTQYVAELKKHSPGRGTVNLRKLLCLVRDYPRAPLLDAVKTAQQFGLYDLDRLERMVLRQIAKNYFVIKTNEGDDEG